MKKQNVKSKGPVCPNCKIEGIEHIISKDSIERSRIDEAWFDIVYCSDCGYVYGVFAKVVNRPVTQFDYQKNQ